MHRMILTSINFIERECICSFGYLASVILPTGIPPHFLGILDGLKQVSSGGPNEVLTIGEGRTYKMLENFIGVILLLLGTFHVFF